MRVVPVLIALLFATSPALAVQPASAGSAGGGPEDAPEAQYGFSGLEIYKLESGIFGLAFGDLDGDGRDDFAFINNPRSRVELFIRLPDDVADEIDPADPDLYNEITYDGRFKKENLAFEQEVYGLTLGSFGGGEALDAAMITSTPELAVELRGSGRDIEKLEDFDPRPGGLVSMDLDGDGLDDPIILGEKKTLVKLSDGEPVVLHNYAQKPGSLKLGDFNGDGLEDLLYVYYEGDYPFVIRFQEEPGVFGPAATWKLETIRAFDVADADGDGKDEIFAVYAMSGRLALFALEPAEKPYFYFHALRRTGDSGKIAFTVADTDGNGADEILVSDAEAARIIVMAGFGAGSASQRTEYPSLKGVDDPRVADFNGDGRNDLAVISGDEGVIGISSLEDGVSFPRFIAVEGKPLALAAGDVTGDGLADAVCISVTGSGRNKEYMLSILNYGHGEEAVQKITIQDSDKNKGMLSKEPDDMVLADVNRDGLADVILMMPKEVPVILFNATGDKPPFETHMGEDTPGLGLLEGARPWTIAPSDGDGDGLSELAVASGNLVRFIFIPPEGDVPQAVRQYNNPSPGGRLAGCAVADITGEGVSDLVVYEATTRSVRVVGSDDAELMRLDAGRLDFRGVATPDLNGDGKRDLAVLGTERIGVWISGETGDSLTEKATFESDDKDAYFQDVAAGDVNADGVVDAVVVELNKSSLVVVSVKEGEMEKALKFRVFEEKLFHSRKGSREPRAVKIHDLTGDGLNDVIILVHDKIIIYPQD